MISRVRQVVQRELFRRETGHFPALDGIRAVAILLVVLFHATAWVALVGGGVAGPGLAGDIRRFFGELWLGVDVFFVLSGFLIGRILLVQLRDGPIDYRGFYIRRVARIVPAYYVVLTVAVFGLSRLPAFDLLYRYLSWGELWRLSLKDYLFLANYLRDERTPELMGWAWSLCVEEHFYLVLPVTLALLFRAPAPVRLAALVLLPLCPMAARGLAFLANPETRLWHRLHWESHTHADGLLLGVLIAYLYVYHQARLARLARRLHTPMLLVAFACFASVFWRGGVFRTGFFPVVAQLFAISFGTAMVVTTCLFVDDRLARCLAHPFWYPIARVSYGMYLIHPFVALGLLRFGPDVAHHVLRSAPELVAFGALTATCSFLLACVLFLCVELPVLRTAARVAKGTRSG